LDFLFVCQEWRAADLAEVDRRRVLERELFAGRRTFSNGSERIWSVGCEGVQILPGIALPIDDVYSRLAGEAYGFVDVDRRVRGKLKQLVKCYPAALQQRMQGA
jgi:hypothetical protein